MSKYDEYSDIVCKLHKERKTNAEIGREVKVDPRRVGEILKKNGLKGHRFSESYDNIVLNNTQNQVLIGGLMGDMCVFKDSHAKHYRMNCAHSTKQKDYLEYKYSLLEGIFNQPTHREWVDKRTLNLYSEERIQSRTHPFFTELHTKWYKDGIKFISSDFNEIEAMGIAIWYMDDGYKHISFNKYKRYLFSTNSFNHEDLLKATTILESKFGIRSTIQMSNMNISIASESNTEFYNLINPYVIKQMKYKL